MLSDAELTQMLADAQRIEALRGKATFPWRAGQLEGEDGPLRRVERWDESGKYSAYDVFEDPCVEDIAFAVASRTDPSAANVLRLVEENQVMRSALLKIRHLSRNRNAKIDDAIVIAKLAIGTKAVKGGAK